MLPLRCIRLAESGREWFGGNISAGPFFRLASLNDNCFVISLTVLPGYHRLDNLQPVPMSYFS
ncbi:unnamed protein product [Penicillium roqueforti FM164]|uniref:Genomic scaffold, ProqFM164S02 n=1 Tax=Penicillium roqueforti (strain FM164) TaxID=1365484 RepID=W6QFH2_PENRF|nr:unnamed protein product [Penicillium roqueforti FM164]